MIKSNLKLEDLNRISRISRDIREWLIEQNHPEKYSKETDLYSLQNYLHSLDLIETILTHFALNVFLSKLPFKELDISKKNTIGWMFWQIAIEHYFAVSFLELCYQLSNLWKQIQSIAEREPSFNIFRANYKSPSTIILTMHKSVHVQPNQYQKLPLAWEYSIPRRPYRIVNGILEKERAKETMRKVRKFILEALKEGSDYLSHFKKATVG